MAKHSFWWRVNTDCCSSNWLSAPIAAASAPLSWPRCTRWSLLNTVRQSTPTRYIRESPVWNRWIRSPIQSKPDNVDNNGGTRWYDWGKYRISLALLTAVLMIVATWSSSKLMDDVSSCDCASAVNPNVILWQWYSLPVDLPVLETDKRWPHLPSAPIMGLMRTGEILHEALSD